MPKGYPLTKIGVWEDGVFIGCVIFGRGASDALLKPYGLSVTEGCELVRVALTRHRTPVSRIVSLSILLLKRFSPGLRLVVSFADPLHGHVGGIYQAGNWIYSGETSSDCFYIDKRGRKWHSRNVSVSGVKLNFGRPTRCPKPSECKRVETPGKYRYLMPLDVDMRARLLHLIKPYPKRGRGAENGTAVPTAGGGVNPTRPLQ